MREIEGKGLEKPITPERLSDEQLGNLISSVGNHEAKAITLLLMQPDVIYTQRDLFRIIINAQGERPGWRMHSSVPFEYCQNSLSPIGLVAKEVLEREGLTTYGYLITEYGIKVGVPLAGYMLDFSQKYPDFSLIDIFGATQSSSQTKELPDQGIEFKKRAPITRLKIFWELLTSSLPIREVYLAKSLGEKNETIIKDHLEALGGKGVISYEATEHGSPFAFYQLNPDHPPEQPLAYRDQPSLTERVYRVLQEDPVREWAWESLTRYLGYTNLPRTISSILSHLEKTGYAKRGKFSEEYRSEVNLTGEQRAMLAELMAILDRFQTQDPQVLQNGKKLAFSLTPSDVAALMGKAKEHSNNASAQPQEETALELLTIVSENPGLTSSKITDCYAQLYGRWISGRLVSLRLRELVREGKISYQVQKDVRKYTAG